MQQHRQQLSAVAIGNLGHLPIAEGLGLPLWGDLGLNLFNSESLLFWKELGAGSRRRVHGAAVAAAPGPAEGSALRGGGIRPPAADDHGKLRHPQRAGLPGRRAGLYGPLPCLPGAARRTSWWTAPGRSSPWWASGAIGARSKTVRCCSWRISRSGGQLGLTRARLRFTTESPGGVRPGAAGLSGPQRLPAGPS